MRKRIINIIAPIVANAQALVFVEERMRLFNDPADDTKTAAMHRRLPLLGASCDLRLNIDLLKPRAECRRVVRSIGSQLLRFAKRARFPTVHAWTIGRLYRPPGFRAPGRCSNFYFAPAVGSMPT